MKRYAIFARIMAGVMLLVFWGLVDSPLSSVAFLLALSALSAVRYRFAPYRSLGLIEALLCVAYAFLWLPALLALWLPLIGFLESRWTKLERELLSKDYEDRAMRLRLEDEREHSAHEIKNAARIAELSERSRIAQDIHDHVGHEISGALIAVQTAVRLYKKGDERAGELLLKTTERLESASGHLRSAVHNLKPALAPGIEPLEKLCAEFSFCPVSFSSSGDLSGFSNWELLNANLKEALTNTARHSNASQVTVRLDGNAAYVRMLVMDNGETNGAVFKPGLGLSGIKERVRVAGGTITVNSSGGFQIICVLPKKAVEE